MQINTLSVGPLETNCHVIWNDDRRALVIDPGDEPETIQDFLRSRRLKVAAYAVTHGHMDHISALAALSDEMPAAIGMHSLEMSWAFSEQNEMPPFYGVPNRPADISRSLQDGQEWDDTGSVYRVIATPGHSPGSVCFYFPGERALVSGDTLFRGSVGRTDLPGGDGRLLACSLRELAKLPADTVVYTGHGPETDIETELRTNPFLTGMGP